MALAIPDLGRGLGERARELHVDASSRGPGPPRGMARSRGIEVGEVDEVRALDR